ncbi:MAG: coenzyme F420-0:L-glutamate ligase [Candidatus Hodarchaeota archaeon]
MSTPIIQPGSNLTNVLITALSSQGVQIEPKDVIVCAETVVAMAQNRIRDLSKVQISPSAQKLSEQYEIEAPLAQLIIEEADEILGGVPRVLLTIKNATLMANAGIDRSNAPPGHVVLLPMNPTDAAWEIKTNIESRIGHEVGVIIADSRTQPLRLGTVGLAVAVAGIDPIKDYRGHPDLFNRPLQITRSAVADNLASAAQVLLGEADEQVPFVLIRGAPVTFTQQRILPETMTISRQDCLYMAVFQQHHNKIRI